MLLRGLAARRLVVPPPRAQLFVRSLSSRKKPKKPVRVPELCSAERLAKALKLPLPSLLEQAEALGEPVADAGSLVSAELMELLAGEAGVPLNVATVDSFRRPPPSADERARLPARPPVVALMGHVDHGKTSMLDAFRGSQLAAAEAGGITQAISAFTVDAGTPSAITFLDTPGHELFAGMRARGARSTDVLLLVVALDAGVQATTREAIAYAKDAGLPMVVAANKYDREGREAAVKKLSAQLVQAGVLLEEMGGDVPLVPCSATKGLHLDDVRDALLLQAELLDLRAEEKGQAEGVVLEAFTQKGLGTLATVLVQRGELKVGQNVAVGTTGGKVRLMHDEQGGSLRVAGPSTAVRLAGLRELPRAGDELLVLPSEAEVREVTDMRAMAERIAREADAAAAAALAAAEEAEAAPAAAEEEPKKRVSKRRRRGGRDAADVLDPLAAKQVPALLKADSHGALEAAVEGLAHFPNNRVELKLVSSAVGALSEADVQLAHSVGAHLVSFNAPLPPKVNALAEQLGVGVVVNDVIYELVDGVKEVLEEAIEPVIEEHERGNVEVLQTFTLTLNTKDRKAGMVKKTQVAGGRVTVGEARTRHKARVLRGDEVLYDGKIVSLRHFKETVASVKKGSECGVILHNFGDAAEGDRISFYEEVPRKPHLYEELTEAELKLRAVQEDEG